MFNLNDSEDEKFNWDLIGDISNGRRNLGGTMPVYIYRLFQFTLKDELIKRFGKEVGAEIFRNAGKAAGIEFANNILDLKLPFNEFIASVQIKLEENKIGIFRMENFNTETGEMIMTISEDLDCSGLPITGETVCYYDEGFLAGVLEVYTRQKYKVTEIDCWASGARVCRFKAEKEC